jgi:hypothetical protein
MAPNTVFTPKSLMELLLKLCDLKSKPKFTEKMIESFGNQEAMGKIIAQQCECREQTPCHLCNRESICLLLNGFAYLDLGQNESGIKELEMAIMHFRSEGITCCLIIGLILIGYANERIKKDKKALLEYEKAHDVIKDYLRFYEKDYIEEAIAMEKTLQNKLDELNS